LPYNPARQAGRFGLLPFRSPLLRESSLFLRVLRCFSSPGSPPEAMCSPQAAWACPHAGFPIRTSPAQRLHTPYRGFTQCTTSFIGSWHQGIHRMLLVAYPTCDTEKLMFSRVYHIYATVNVHRPRRPGRGAKSPWPHAPTGVSASPRLSASSSSLVAKVLVPAASAVGM
jgi:hypothetical protein